MNGVVRKKDWRRTAGMFDGDPRMREMLEEGQRRPHDDLADRPGTLVGDPNGLKEGRVRMKQVEPFRPAIEVGANDRRIEAAPVA